jgi:mRNA-degrading endonuclease toxin of MazEF toxin-antitoxin module
MKSQRGDVVLVSYPFASGGGSKVRPALVIQCDRNNGRLDNTIVAQIIPAFSTQGLNRPKCWFPWHLPQDNRQGS